MASRRAVLPVLSMSAPQKSQSYKKCHQCESMIHYARTIRYLVRFVKENAGQITYLCGTKCGIEHTALPPMFRALDEKDTISKRSLHRAHRKLPLVEVIGVIHDVLDRKEVAGHYLRPLLVSSVALQACMTETGTYVEKPVPANHMPILLKPAFDVAGLVRLECLAHVTKDPALARRALQSGEWRAMENEAQSTHKRIRAPCDEQREGKSH
jgi:hypothetical protein